MMGHYTTWALAANDPASRSRTGDIAVAAQLPNYGKPYYSRALYQAELRRVLRLCCGDMNCIKHIDAGKGDISGRSVYLL